MGNAGPFININSFAGRDALHLACVYGELEMVKWLIHSCALSPTIKDKYGESPIHVAIREGYPEIVEFLVEYDGSLISSVDEKTGFFPLHEAVRWDKLEIAQLLLKHGSDVLQPTEQGTFFEGLKGLTPLHIAVQEESLECIDELLNYLDVDSVHPILNNTPIQIFLEYANSWTDRHVHIMEKMLSKGKKLNT